MILSMLSIEMSLNSKAAINLVITNRTPNDGILSCNMIFGMESIEISLKSKTAVNLVIIGGTQNDGM